MMLHRGFVQVANPSSVITILELHTSHRSRFPDGLYTHSTAVDNPDDFGDSSSSAMNADSSFFHKSVLFLQSPFADLFLWVLPLNNISARGIDYV
jgi:hypothetical protein